MMENAQLKQENLDIYNFSSLHSTDEVLSMFNSSLDGLSDEQVSASLKKYGSNNINYDKQDSLLKRLIKAFISPFTLVLLLLAAVSFVTDFLIAAPSEKKLTTVIIILVMVTLSGSVSFIQSVRSSKAASQLKSLVKVTSMVKRKDLQPQEISVNRLVCGDIVYLAAGDMIPADLRIIEAKELFISQSSMTGESLPIEKTSETCTENKEQTVLDDANLVFMGSNVVTGSAIGIVIMTGTRTQFGQIAHEISEKRDQTSFELGISSVSLLLLRFMAVMAPLVFVINGVTKGNWLEAFLFAITIAVGLTPEMLPMVVTANLVKGSITMSKEGTIIKDINSIQNFGAMDILCTDKTGTLTQDKIILEYHMDLSGKENNDVLEHAYLNSYFQTGLRNLLDHAVIDSAQKELSIDISKYQKVDEIPFDFIRRRMSVVIKMPDAKIQMITKGAVEEVLAVSKFVEIDGEIDLLTPVLKEQVISKVEELNNDGFRVIALAQKHNPTKQHDFSIEDEQEMVLMGYLAFLDPPKKSAKDAIDKLKVNGITVKVLTGDNALITKTVCKQVGIDVNNEISGFDIDKLDETELRKVIEENDVFVKLTPQQKTRIVTALRLNGHVVGYMGDGINDAAAMKKADVGISVDTAVDIAKSSADVILLEKDLNILNVGVISGRKIFANIMKYVKITASSNYGNMFSVVIASIFLPFLPMLPIQLLILNLIYDFSSTSMPWDNVDAEYLKKPRKWETKSISSFMKRIGPMSSIFDITTYLLMFFIICPQVVGGSYQSLSIEGKIAFVALFNAGWFVESLWSQTIIIHTLRTPKTPFIKSRASFIVSTVTAAGILVGTILPFTSLGRAIGMVALPGNYFIWLIITITCYVIVVSVAKQRYIKRYHELI